MCFAYFHARYRSVSEPLLLQVNPGALKKDLLSAGHGRHLKTNSIQGQRLPDEAPHVTG